MDNLLKAPYSWISDSRFSVRQLRTAIFDSKDGSRHLHYQVDVITEVVSSGTSFKLSAGRSDKASAQPRARNHLQVTFVGSTYGMLAAISRADYVCSLTITAQLFD